MINISKVVVIRHGETLWNVDRKLQGQGNSDLTKLGVKQAELAAGAIQAEKFDFCYSSDLPRCIHTAEIITRNLGLDIITDERLRERNFGVLQGMTKEEIENVYPEIFQRFKMGNINFEVPKGESFNGFFNRVKDFFEDQKIMDKQNKNILVITHGGVLDCLMRMIMNISLDAHRNYSIYNTSINRFSILNDVWKIDTWGDINHLSTISTTDDF